MAANELAHHEDEVRHRQEYEQKYGNPDSAPEQIKSGNAAADTDHNLKGPLVFMRAL